MTPTSLCAYRARRSQSAAPRPRSHVVRFFRPPIVLQAESGGDCVEFIAPTGTLQWSADEAIKLAADLIRLARAAGGAAVKPGHRKLQLGHDNESAVECCCLVRNIAPWLHWLRRATPEEDREGIDVVAETDWFDVPIQVKSGVKRAHDHQRKHPDIPYVVVYPGDSEDKIRRNVRAAVRIGLRKQGVNPDERLEATE